MPNLLYRKIGRSIVKSTLIVLLNFTLLVGSSIASAECFKGRFCDENKQCEDVVVCCNKDGCVIYTKMY